MKSTSTTYPVMEHFYTIQGEGFYQGHAAYFIRLGGCDVGCVWCDVKESWEAEKHPSTTVSYLVAEVLKTNCKLVVITGGEPLMYDLSELCNALKCENIQVNIETSGAYPLSGSLDWICFSPKKFKEPLADVAVKAHELKVIIFNKSDFKFAEKYRKQVSTACKLYLQVEWEKRMELSDDIISYVKDHPEWSISVQTHKYLNIP